MKLEHWRFNGATSLDDRSNYMGENLSRLLVVPVSQHRDSDALDRSNFRVALERLGGESETVQVHRFGSWAVGWHEMLLITADGPVTEAEKIAAELADYPVLDEEDYSELEWSEMTAYWAGESIAERVRLCSKYGLSIFSARHDYIPDNSGDLDQYLRGD